jgi:signal peptidase I
MKKRTSAKKKSALSLRKRWSDWCKSMLLVACILIPVKSSLADWNRVPTGSMNPTIMEGDLVYINKLAYDLRFPLTLHSLKRWSDPERGDISVLFSPDDRTRLVKRVIGLPGDEIEMRNNILFLNDRRLEYTALSPVQTMDLESELRRVSVFAEENLDGRRHAIMSIPQVQTPHRSFQKVTIPEGHYFVMGDNRDNSRDSRIFGFAERKLFVGEATSVIVSFNMLDRYQPRLCRFFRRLE